MWSDFTVESRSQRFSNCLLRGKTSGKVLQPIRAVAGICLLRDGETPDGEISFPIVDEGRELFQVKEIDSVADDAQMPPLFDPFLVSSAATPGEGRKDIFFPRFQLNKFNLALVQIEPNAAPLVAA